MKYDNLYYSSIGRCATQWFRKLLTHSIVRKYTYTPFHYQVDMKGGHHINEPHNKQTMVAFPKNTIIYCIQCTYKHFTEIPKSENFRGVYVYRDPRELIMSAYWSHLQSHPGGHPNREKLQKLSLVDGIKFTIDWHHRGWLRGFESMLDWVENCQDERFKIYKFRDIFVNPQTQNEKIREILNFFDVPVTENELEVLQEQLRYKNLSAGRQRGEENKNHHYRCGQVDTWKEQMPPEALQYFYEQTGDLVERLGFERE